MTYQILGLVNFRSEPIPQSARLAHPTSQAPTSKCNA